MPKMTIPENWLKRPSHDITNKQVSRRFEVEEQPNAKSPTHADNNISVIDYEREQKGGGRLESQYDNNNKATGNLVGRGIANPMSERTRGFEMSSFSSPS
jgi:hypothetical protein